MDIAVTAFCRVWIDIHGPPHQKFKGWLTEHSIKIEPRPVRRQNKIGIVESRHSRFRLICLRRHKDVQYYRSTRGIYIPPADFLSKGPFLAYILRGNSKLSSFELARGYLPAILELTLTIVSKEWLISKILQTRLPKLIKPALLPRDKPVYYFVKEAARN